MNARSKTVEFDCFDFSLLVAEAEHLANCLYRLFRNLDGYCSDHKVSRFIRNHKSELGALSERMDRFSIRIHKYARFTERSELMC